MKHIPIIISIIVLFTSESHSQINDSLHCNITETQIDLNSIVYENPKDKTYKIYFEEFGMVNTLMLYRDVEEEWAREDTISETNPIESVINEFDEIMDISSFENLSSNYAEGQEVSFEKHVDIVGDGEADKIVFVEEMLRGKKYLTVYVYENVSGEFIKYDMCYLRFEEYPTSFYVSKIENLGMKTLIFIYEGHLPGKTLTMKLLTANRISAPYK